MIKNIYDIKKTFELDSFNEKCLSALVELKIDVIWKDEYFYDKVKTWVVSVFSLFSFLW